MAGHRGWGTRDGTHRARAVHWPSAAGEAVGLGGHGVWPRFGGGPASASSRQGRQGPWFGPL